MELHNYLPAEGKACAHIANAQNPHTCIHVRRKANACLKQLYSMRPRSNVWSYLRLSQTLGADHHDFRAVCKLHGQCQKSKTGRTARPLGSLWAWLGGASNFGNKEDHQSFVPSYEARRGARVVVAALDGSEDFLNAERAQRPGEDVEPASFLG